MMAMSGTPATAEHPSRRWKRVSLLSLLPPLAFFLAACGSSGRHTPPPDPPDPPPAQVMPAGRLAQAVDKGPITHVTERGWRTRIENGAVTIQPPEDETQPGIQYIAWRMRDQLGTHDLRAWSGERRSLLLPGGAKITMHGQAGEIMRLSLYDGAESHEVDVLTQTLMHSRVDAGVAQARDAAEADGETGHLRDFEHGTGPNSQISRLHLANLYMQAADADGAPLRREADVRVLGRLSHVDLEVNPLGAAPAAEADEACTPTTEPRGNLVRLGDGTLQYTTRSGLWTVHVDQHTITMLRSGKFKWEVWGDPHENLNGKHIKDWEGDRRTLLLDDGAKITMHADGPQQVVHTTNIYNGAQSHEIGNVGNAVRHSCVNAGVAATREAQEADGETAHLSNLRGPAVSIGYLYVETVYHETEGADEPEEPEFAPETLGETGDAELNPTQIRDYYDDPRLGHT